MKKSLNIISILIVFILSSCNETDKITDDEEKNDTDNYIQDIDTQDEDPDPCDDGKKWHKPVTLIQTDQIISSRQFVPLDNGKSMLLYFRPEGDIDNNDYTLYFESRIYSMETGWDEINLVERFDIGDQYISVRIEDVSDHKGGSFFLIAEKENWTNGELELFLYEYSLKDGWKEPQSLDSLICTPENKVSFSQPSVSTNDKGDIAVRWGFTDRTDPDFPKSTAFVKIYSKSNGWSEVYSFNTDQKYEYVSPSILLDSDGDVTALTITKMRNEDEYIYQILRYSEEEGWQEPENSPFDKSLGGRWARIYEKTNIFTTLTVPDSELVWTARYIKGEGWQEDKTMLRSIESGEYEFDNISLSINSHGDVVATWNETYATSFVLADRLWANIYTSQTGWQGEKIVVPASSDSDIKPFLSDNRDIFVVWREYRQAGSYFDRENYIWAKRHMPDYGWCSHEIISEHYESYLDSPDVIVDEKGNAILVWGYDSDGDGNSDSIRYSEFY